VSQRLPILTAKELSKAIRKCGFSFYRQRGSHQIWKHSDGRWTTIPVHPGENIGRGLLRKILKDINLQPKEFIKLFKKK